MESGGGPADGGPVATFALVYTAKSLLHCSLPLLDVTLFHYHARGEQKNSHIWITSYKGV